jgi:hypothetical protein
MMSEPRFLGVCKIFAALIVLLAAIGGVRNYSPVPFWDMWDGTLGFYIKVMDGDLAAWWAQHNEHRIVLARLFFWVDYKLFGGLSIFLVAVNYVLAGLSCLVFWRFSTLLSLEHPQKIDCRIMGPVIVSLMFFWSQWENFTWGFQSQFFLAQLLPLSGFLLLAMSQSDEARTRLFLAACLLGLLSAGSMANGILTLPLMLIYSFVMRMGIRRSLVLLLLSVLVDGTYLYDFQSVARHGRLMDSILNFPIETFQFFVMYLGSPIGFLGRGFSFILGSIILFLSLRVILKEVIFEGRSPFRVALIFFIIYIMATAFGTAGGRVNFGLDAALASRYTTPVLMLMTSLLILFQKQISSPPVLGLKNIKRWLPIVLVGVFMFVYQVRASNPAQEAMYPRQVGALALSLGIKDDDFIKSLSPDSNMLLRLALVAEEREYSVFGRAPFYNIKEELGSDSRFEAGTRCVGNVDSVDNIKSVDGFIRIRGWVYDPVENSVPSFIRLTTAGGSVAGFALTGASRPDVAAAVLGKPHHAGFTGYILESAAGSKITIFDQDAGCYLVMNVPVVLVKIKTYDDGKKFDFSGVVGDAAISSDRGWGGSDYLKSVLEGMVIKGSLVTSDADKGILTMAASRGNRFLFRSGPTGGRQVLKIVGTDLVQVMPVATEWVWVELSGHNLPDKFEMELVDDGDGWGEWSAVALRQQ